jgi:aminoglycoside phosphotransferase (APT) family kinase protein
VDLFTSLTPLEGGWSGETFVAEAGGERSVVRIFANPRHHPEAAEIQEALLRLVRGLVPVPAVKEVRRADPDAGTPGLLVTELLPGVRADLVLPTLDDRGRARLGERLGRIAATLAGMPFLTSGTFVDGGLRIDPFRLDLEDWVAQHEERLGWTDDELDGLREVARTAQDRLDETTRVSLVHSDLNPKNVLVDPDTLELVGVLDWEFAHAGHPYADLGNLIRFDRDPAYVEGVLRGWTGLRGGDPESAVEAARSADLFALVELAGRKDANPVAARAHELLLEAARTRDLHSTVG